MTGDVSQVRPGFHWLLEGLNKRRFHAAVKLLLLHLGRQAEESTRYTGDLESVADDLEDFGEVDSLNALQTSGAELSELKRAFLDRLAELLSHSPRGPHVAAAGLAQQVDHIYVVVAKNNFMDQKSIEMIHYLQGVFRQLSALDPLSIYSVHHCCDK